MNEKLLEVDILQGLSLRNLSKKYKKSLGSIRYWIKKYGLKTKNKKIGDGYIPPHVKKFIECGSSYKNIDWETCKKSYDSGMTWNELVKKFHISNEAIRWAIKNNKIKTRNISEAQKLAWKYGKQKAEIYKTPEHRRKMSIFGGYRENSGRIEKSIYIKNGQRIWLQGSWEVKMANFLDTNSIEWEKNRIGYKYIFNGREHLYFPDFYLKDYQVYVEVKGYETERDRAKWSQFPFKLIVIKKQEIQDLDSWWKGIGLYATRTRAAENLALNQTCEGSSPSGCTNFWEGGGIG